MTGYVNNRVTKAQEKFAAENFKICLFFLHYFQRKLLMQGAQLPYTIHLIFLGQVNGDQTEVSWRKLEINAKFCLLNRDGMNKWCRDNSGRNNSILLRYSESIISCNTASDEHITTFFGIQTGTLKMEAPTRVQYCVAIHKTARWIFTILKNVKTHTTHILSWRLSVTWSSHRHTRSSKTHISLHLGNQLQFSLSKFMTTNDSRWKTNLFSLHTFRKIIRLGYFALASNVIFCVSVQP